MILASTSTDVMVAAIAAVPASIVAYATYLKVKSTGKGLEDLTTTNTQQHVGTSAKLDDVAERQQWVITQLAEIRQALLAHVLWEQGGIDDPHGSPHGKYHDLERQLADIERTMKEQS